MISKNTLNFAHLLLLVLFTAILLDPLVNAQSKTFEISKTHASSKAIVSSSDKKIEVKVAFNPVDYNTDNDRSFDLNVGGCKLAIDAWKYQDGSTVGFWFYNGIASKTISNPKSFEITGQELIFEELGGDKRNVNCNQEINFVSIDGDQSTIELSLAGDIPENLILSSDNLAYDDDESAETKAKANVWLFVGIGVGIFVAFLLIVASIFVVICIKRMKQKIVGKKSKEQVKTAISAEISTAKEVSKEHTSSVKDNKPAKSAPRNEKQNVEKDLNTNALKAEKDQKLGAQEEQTKLSMKTFPMPKYRIRKEPVLNKEQIAKREHYRKLYYESLKNNPGPSARIETNGVDIEGLARRGQAEEDAFITAMEEKDAANESAKEQDEK